MTPHKAGVSVKAMIRMAADAAKGSDEALSGKQPAYAFSGTQETILLRLPGVRRYQDSACKFS